MWKKQHNKKYTWFWILMVVAIVLAAGTLAMTWNLAMVRDFRRIIDEIISQSISLKSISLQETEHSFELSIILGILGFSVALGGTILISTKLLKEMRLNQLQTEFIASVSHSLKTPIATMELCSSLLQSPGLSAEETSRLWDSHNAELRRLKEEVMILLESARWQSDVIKLDLQRLALEDWINQSLPRWQQLLGLHAKIERQGQPLNCHAVVDPRAMNLIMDNLIENAHKFAREVPHVVIRTRMYKSSMPWKPTRWQIQVEDQGWGFDPADAERIFHRFFRSRSTAPHAIAGTGLGLYLAASASRAMGTTLKGESEGYEKGATFTLEGDEETDTNSEAGYSQAKHDDHD